MRTLAVAILIFLPSIILARSNQPRAGCDSAVLGSGSTAVENAADRQDEKYRRPAIVKYEIEEDGAVRKVKLVYSSGVKNLNDRLLAAASQWKYQARPGCGVMKVSLAAGSIPDADTAIKVAEPEMIRIYGAGVIKSERPIAATLSGDIWIVTGTLYCKDGKGRITTVCFGGVATAHLSKSDGRILNIFHTR
jgi:TonB family protein